MKTYAQLQKTLDHFLNDSKPGVFSIKGHWGVGKTFALTEYFLGLKKREKDFKELEQSTYSYCSLFGQQSIDTIKSTLCGSFEPIFEQRCKGKKHLLKRVPGSLKAVDGLQFPFLGKIKGTDLLAQVLLEQSIQNLVVCFDDLDRKEPALTDSAFLGLVTGLRDLKNCKVILLYNDDIVEDEKDTNEVFKSFMEYREKVVDYEFAFRPSPDECFEIAFKGNKLGISLTADNEPAKAVLTALRPLKLSNIRILKKVRNALECFKDTLSQKYPKSLSSHHGQIVKLCTIYYRHGADLRLEDILGFTRHLFAAANDNEKNDTKKKKEELSKLLEGYDYHRSDFDKIIASFLRDGYLEISNHCTLLNNIEKRKNYSELQAEHSALWNKLSNNFIATAEEFIEGQKDFLDTHYDEIGIFDMEAALRAINAVGGNIDVFDYMDKRLRSHVRRMTLIWTRRDEAYRGTKELLDRCEEIYWEEHQPLPIDEAIMLMTKVNQWATDDFIYLEPQSEDDFYEYFTTTDDPKLIGKIKELRFRLPHSEKGKEILTKLNSALLRVAERSEIDKLRVRHYISEDLAPDSEEIKPAVTD